MPPQHTLTGHMQANEYAPGTVLATKWCMPVGWRTCEREGDKEALVPLAGGPN